jgi:hypothetical protein
MPTTTSATEAGATGPFEDMACALLDAANRTGALVSRITDGSLPASPTRWTVAQTAVHVIGDLLDHAALLEGTGQVQRFAAGLSAAQRSEVANAEQIEREGERDLTVLANRVVPATQRVVAAARDYHHPTVGMTNALQVTPRDLLGILLAEQLVHGLDIARAAGQPWRISRPEALLATEGVISLLPHYLLAERVRGRRLNYAVRLRGGPTYNLRIDNGIATVDRSTVHRSTVHGSAARADCIISADPVTFLLVGFGRSGQLRAALTGKMTAYGQRPWLAGDFGRLFSAP